ncbi:hypothetical protein [uncultured Methanobrevibacter sp.]|nr:hypothetical protein [uncultured Methanobrevibacter sp.]
MFKLGICCHMGILTICFVLTVLGAIKQNIRLLDVLHVATISFS